MKERKKQNKGGERERYINVKQETAKQQERTGEEEESEREIERDTQRLTNIAASSKGLRRRDKERVIERKNNGEDCRNSTFYPPFPSCLPIQVRSIQEASKNPKLINNWIESISDLHRSKPTTYSALYKVSIPLVEWIYFRRFLLVQ